MCAVSSDSPNQRAAAIELRGITKAFPGVTANKEISLTIEAGEIHALLGENGAGKSTLISILAGLNQPDAGIILIGGIERRILSPRNSLDFGIGTVFQHVLLAKTLSVIENLMLGGGWRKKYDKEPALRRFQELCGLLAVKLDANAPVGSLSLGQRQQVEIMRALWRGGERVLILDEPTSMLTPQGVVELGEVIKRLRDDGVAIVFVTHKLREAYELCDRISVLRDGRLAGQIEPKDRAQMDEKDTLDEIVRMMFGQSSQEETLDEAPNRALEKEDKEVLLTPASSEISLQVKKVSTTAISGECSLREVSFQVAKGEIFGVAGIDGNGQKHLAEILAGQRDVASGQIKLNGENISTLRVSGRRGRGVRYLTDDRIGEGIVSEHPVATNLVLKSIGEEPYWHRGLTMWRKIYEFAKNQIRIFDIRTPSERTPIGRLSGGNIQKTLFAREITEDADMLILNKPTYGLDSHNIQLARERIRNGASKGITTILISTELEELIELANRIGVMYQGHMVGIVEANPGLENQIGLLMTGASRA